MPMFSCGRVIKTECMGVKGLPSQFLDAVAKVGCHGNQSFLSSVNGVTHEGMVHRAHMDSNLMGSSRFWLYLHERDLMEPFLHLPVSESLLGSPSPHRESFPIRGMPADRSDDDASVLGHCSVDQCQVGFLYCSLFKLRREYLMSPIILCNHHDA